MLVNNLIRRVFIDWVVYPLKMIGYGFLVYFCSCVLVFFVLKFGCNNDEEQFKRLVDRIGAKIDSMIGINSEEDKLVFTKKELCVVNRIIPYKILGANIGMATGFICTRSWTGFKKGLQVGAQTGIRVGLYIGAIECDEE